MNRVLPLVLAACAGAYLYNVSENVSARKRARASCDDLRSATADRITRAGPWLEALFADDAPFMRLALAATLDDMCNAVETRLAWWKWNWGTEMSVPVDATRAARMREALAHARDRCPTVASTIFADLPAGHDPSARADFVKKFCSLIDSLDTRSPASAPTTLSPWAPIITP